jgi:hypothetical protein
VLSPAATVVEEVVGGWILDLLGLPASASVGLVTEGQMSNTTCLAVARHAVLERAGWDVEARGLQGAPGVTVIVGDLLTRAVVTGVQEDGTAWLGGTVWQERAAMRIAVSSHATTEEDARLTVAAILAAWRSVSGRVRTAPRTR